MLHRLLWNSSVSFFHCFVNLSTPLLPLSPHSLSVSVGLADLHLFLCFRVPERLYSVHTLLFFPHALLFIVVSVPHQLLCQGLLSTSEI